MAVESVGRDGRLVRPLVLIRLDRLCRCFRFGSLFSTVSCFYAFLHTPFPSFLPIFYLCHKSLSAHCANHKCFFDLFYVPFLCASLPRSISLPSAHVCFMVFSPNSFFFLHLISLFVTIFSFLPVRQSVRLPQSV